MDNISSSHVTLQLPVPSLPTAAETNSAENNSTHKPVLRYGTEGRIHEKITKSSKALSIVFFSLLAFFSLTALVFDIVAVINCFVPERTLSLILYGTDSNVESDSNANVFTPNILFDLLNGTSKPSLPDTMLPEESESYPTEDTYPIKSTDISSKNVFGLEASNETAYDIDLISYLENEYPISPLDELHAVYGEEAPTVLILHTHGTEAYAEDDGEYYSIIDNCRSTDTTKNVVAIGAVMADYFNQNGIVTIHSREMFDAESYVNAYDYANEAIKEYVAIYPSIKYVFDVHRDSLITDDMTKLRPVTFVDSVPTAQYMCVIGTDENAGRHVNWERNLTFACHLQSRLWERSSSLTRRMSIRSASYNQRHADGSLLLEIGSCGNTLEEAKACALLVAEEITSLIKGE